MEPFSFVVIFLVVFFVFKFGIKPLLTRKPNFPADFQATYYDKNIAIDTNSRRVWLKEGRNSAVLPASDILTWTHQWVDTSNALGTLFHLKNKIEITTPDIDRPVWSISFDAAIGMIGAKQDYKNAREWQSRLTAFLNHS